MRFVDEVTIWVKAGDGGDGCVSFLREKYVPRGGPDGGDGGKGGDVIIRVNPHLNTLLELVSRPQYHAGDGRPGRGRNQTGPDGDDVVIEVPLGTEIIDQDTGLTLADLKTPGQSIVAARAGKGGRGNARFASAVDQAPRRYEEGQNGQERNLRLELRLVADVGLIGLPNAGKSTLLSRISAAHPKIAAYPFTTLQPAVGIVDTASYQRFTVADLPGLIEGAHDGKGLGDEFLRHIERTRIVAHLIDVRPVDGSDPVENYHTIRDELRLHSQKLSKKPEVVIASKMDLHGAEENLARLRSEVPAEVLPVSAVSGRGIRELVGRIVHILNELRQQPEPDELPPAL